MSKQFSAVGVQEAAHLRRFVLLEVSESGGVIVYIRHCGCRISTTYMFYMWIYKSIVKPIQKNVETRRCCAHVHQLPDQCFSRKGGRQSSLLLALTVLNFPGIITKADDHDHPDRHSLNSSETQRRDSQQYRFLYRNPILMIMPAILGLDTSHWSEKKQKQTLSPRIIE